MTTRENITKAADTAQLLHDDLRAALKTADPVLGLLLLDMIRQSAELMNRLGTVRAALADEDDQCFERDRERATA